MPERQYEIVYIITPTLNKDDASAEVKKNHDILEKCNIKILNEKMSELQKFTYPIKKQTSGYYVVVNISLRDQKKLEEFKDKIKFDNNILRYIILKSNAKIGGEHGK